MATTRLPSIPEKEKREETGVASVALQHLTNNLRQDNQSVLSESMLLIADGCKSILLNPMNRIMRTDKQLLAEIISAATDFSAQIKDQGH